MSNSLQPHGLQHTRFLRPPLAHIHVYWVSDAIWPSHPLPPSSAFAFNLSQHQGFSSESTLRIKWPKDWSFSFSIVLPMNIQGWFPLRLTGLVSLLSKGLSRVFSSTTIQNHKFFSAQPPLWSKFHFCPWLLEKPQLWLYGPLPA